MTYAHKDENEKEANSWIHFCVTLCIVDFSVQGLKGMFHRHVHKKWRECDEIMFPKNKTELLRTWRTGQFSSDRFLIVRSNFSLKRARRMAWKGWPSRQEFYNVESCLKRRAIIRTATLLFTDHRRELSFMSRLNAKDSGTYAHDLSYMRIVLP